MNGAITLARRFGPVWLAQLGLVLFWRAFPWPGGRGRYFFKRAVLNTFARPSAAVPMWTDAGWLLLERGGDVLQNSLFLDGRHYETQVVRLLRQVPLGKEAVVVDVGAHAGYYTLLLARRVGPRGLVVAFEAQERLARAVAEAARLNGISWVRAENLAVSDACGHARFFRPEDTGRSSLAAQGLAGTQALEVETTTLDAYVASRLGRDPALVKVDIEGGEWLALAGMERTLSEGRPRLLIEVHPAAIEVLGGSQERLVERLSQGFGYRLRHVRHDSGLGELTQPLPQATTWHLFAEPT